MYEEALGTLIDYRVGFCNIDQAEYIKAMPPTGFLTSPIGYVRLHGRNPQDWKQEFGRAGSSLSRHDYLYSRDELREWQPRIEHLTSLADNTFVFLNNDIGGKGVVNALQLCFDAGRHAGTGARRVDTPGILQSSVSSIASGRFRTRYLGAGRRAVA